jgi:prolyl oligopeptidase
MSSVNSKCIVSLFKPKEGSSIYGLKILEKGIVINYLNNVLGKLVLIKLHEQNKVLREDINLGNIGEHAQLANASYSKSLVIIRMEDYISPTLLASFQLDKKRIQIIKKIKPQFDAKGMTFKQFWVESADGEKIPYFVMGKKSVLKHGKAPTIVFAYGGFGVTYPPSYEPLVGKNWLEAGGLYVEANIRGGGEFGPKWHAAALKEKREVAFDDFLAVSKDLIKRGLAAPDALGAYSGSNGGYLLGAAMIREPSLFKAIAVKVPLFDMLNFHRFLSGPNWVSEYGDPENLSEREFLTMRSPYQNLKKGTKYPPMFIYTSSSDDRVHPMHARKMAARLEEYGNEVLFYESTEGGHGGAVTSSQAAYWKSMMFEFFTDKLINQRNK